MLGGDIEGTIAAPGPAWYAAPVKTLAAAERCEKMYWALIVGIRREVVTYEEASSTAVLVRRVRKPT